MNSNNTRWERSSYGSKLEIAAPGVGIYSTTVSNGYISGLGTSFAAPQVAATIALLLSINPYLTPDEIRGILANSADKVGGYTYIDQPSRCVDLGFGRLNVKNALSSIYPTLEGVNYVCGSNITYTIDNYPTGASTTWSKSTNLNYVSSTSTTYTVNKNGNGSGWIQASINTGLYNPIILTKGVLVGISRYIVGDHPATLDIEGHWQAVGIDPCNYSYAWYVEGYEDPFYTGSCNFNYTFNDEEWSPGYIEIYCKVSDGQSYIYTDNFSVQLIAHPPLSASFMGDENVCLDTYWGVWWSNVSGGDGEYTFEWYINNDYIETGYNPHSPYLYYYFDSSEWYTSYDNIINLRVYDDSTYFDAPPFYFDLDWCGQKMGSIQVDPNPASDYINISIIESKNTVIEATQKKNKSLKNKTVPSDDEIITYSLFDNLGRQIYQKKTKEKSLRIPVSNFISGIYHLKVFSPTVTADKQIIITH